MKFTNFKLSENKIANFAESQFKINFNLKKNKKANDFSQTFEKYIC